MQFQHHLCNLISFWSSFCLQGAWRREQALHDSKKVQTNPERAATVEGTDSESIVQTVGKGLFQVGKDQRIQEPDAVYVLGLDCDLC